MKQSNIYMRQLPQGVQDYLPDECYGKRQVEETFRNQFLLHGYDEVETPGFEYYHVFSQGLSEARKRQFIKWMDMKGDLVALRSEWTTPIARMAATKVNKFPARFCYIGPAYGCENAYYGSQMEYTQAGIEYLGESSPKADAEVIAIAIESLRAIGLEDFQIELGQVMFFKGLMADAGLSAEQIEELRTYIDQKNELAVALFLQESNIDQTVQETIEKLSTLFGEKEVFDQALQFSANETCRQAVENLREIYQLLCDFGYEDYLLIDFGLLQSIDYYSGLIFKGYVNAIGFPILSGGRYDQLLDGFGIDMPATGCALGVKRIMIALDKQDALPKRPLIDVLVSGDTPKAAYAEMQRLISQGKRAQLDLFLDRQALEKKAKELNATACFAEETTRYES